MRVADIASDAVKELSNQVKEIKQSDDEDLATLAEKFDGIAEFADKISVKLHNADSALTDEGEDEEPQDDEEGEGQPEGEEQPEE